MIVNVPVNGTDEAVVRANAWMFQQVLATGVHGIMLTHADTPGAVRALVESSRLPIHKQAVGAGVTRFSVAILIGRGARYFFEGLLALWYGERAMNYIRDHGAQVALVTIGVLVAGFVIYLYWPRRGAKSV